MEIKELLESMLDNVKNGEPLDYGLIGYNGAINLEKPEHVHRSPHTYITVDQYNEIRDAHDINTVLNRLNLAIEKLMVVTPVQPVSPPVVMPCFIPDGYLWNESKGGKPDFYGKYCADGWTDERLIREGYLLQKPTREFFKPFIAWVCGGCNHVWPKSDYIFTNSQFSNIKNSEFRVMLVDYLNFNCRKSKSFAGLVGDHYISDTSSGIREMEELVNKRLNEIYQKL